MTSGPPCEEARPAAVDDRDARAMALDRLLDLGAPDRVAGDVEPVETKPLTGAEASTVAWSEPWRPPVRAMLAPPSRARRRPAGRRARGRAGAPRPRAGRRPGRRAERAGARLVEVILMEVGDDHRVQPGARPPRPGSGSGTSGFGAGSASPRPAGARPAGSSIGSTRIRRPPSSTMSVAWRTSVRRIRGKVDGRPAGAAGLRSGRREGLRRPAGRMGWAARNSSSGSYAAFTHCRRGRCRAGRGNRLL